MADLNEIVLPDGTTRRLGNNHEPLKLTWKVYGDVPQAPLIPRSQWKPISLKAFLPAIKDQDGVGACNAFDTCNVVEGCRAQQGLPYAKLSPGWLYGNINGQQDNGSLLEDAIKWMTDHGTCLASTVPELAWQKSKWPATAAAEAQDYRLLETFLCPTFDHIGSAFNAGFFVSLGIAWYDGDNIDADGWLPASPRGRMGGHAIAGCGLANRNGKWGAEFANSWGGNWGKSGFGVIPESRFTSAIGGWWASRVTVQPADSGTPPLQV